MNLKITEMNDLGNNDKFDVNNYWEKTNTHPQNTVQKKKFSYDDILNSLNMVVNKNGVLQYMTTNLEPEQQPEQKSSKQVKGKPLEPQVKNSHIYNKYFKDYKDPNNEIVNDVKVPKTIEEYKRMVLEDRIKRIRERNRVAQIKSTKLLFESNINNVNIINNQTIKTSKNNLRMMNFNK